MIFVDSSFFIAMLRAGDQYHSRVRELVKSNSHEIFITSELILAETIVFLQRKDGTRSAATEAQMLLENRSIVYPTIAELKEAVPLMAKYNFSYVDAVSIKMMEGRGIRKILSFDSDFDRIKGIQRIY